MNILNDAEYRRLTEAEKTAYWRARYEEMEAERDQYRERCITLASVMRTIQGLAERA